VEIGLFFSYSSPFFLGSVSICAGRRRIWLVVDGAGRSRSCAGSCTGQQRQRGPWPSLSTKGHIRLVAVGASLWALTHEGYRDRVGEPVPGLFGTCLQDFKDPYAGSVGSFTTYVPTTAGAGRQNPHSRLSKVVGVAAEKAPNASKPALPRASGGARDRWATLFQARRAREARRLARLCRKKKSGARSSFGELRLRGPHVCCRCSECLAETAP